MWLRLALSAALTFGIVETAPAETAPRNQIGFYYIALPQAEAEQVRRFAATVSSTLNDTLLSQLGAELNTPQGKYLLGIKATDPIYDADSLSNPELIQQLSGGAIFQIVENWASSEDQKTFWQGRVVISDKSVAFPPIKVFHIDDEMNHKTLKNTAGILELIATYALIGDAIRPDVAPNSEEFAQSTRIVCGLVAVARGFVRDLNERREGDVALSLSEAAALREISSQIDDAGGIGHYQCPRAKLSL
jgi:hypothetical protein